MLKDIFKVETEFLLIQVIQIWFKKNFPDMGFPNKKKN